MLPESLKIKLCKKKDNYAFDFVATFPQNELVCIMTYDFNTILNWHLCYNYDMPYKCNFWFLMFAMQHRNFCNNNVPQELLPRSVPVGDVDEMRWPYVISLVLAFTNYTLHRSSDKPYINY